MEDLGAENLEVREVVGFVEGVEVEEEAEDEEEVEVAAVVDEEVESEEGSVVEFREDSEEVVEIKEVDVEREIWEREEAARVEENEVAVERVMESWGEEEAVVEVVEGRVYFGHRTQFHHCTKRYLLANPKENNLSLL